MFESCRGDFCSIILVLRDTRIAMRSFLITPYASQHARMVELGIHNGLRNRRPSRHGSSILPSGIVQAGLAELVYAPASRAGLFLGSNPRSGTSPISLVGKQWSYKP